MADLIRIDCRDGVAVLTLNRPQRRNALSFPLLGALSEALSNAVADDAVAVVLTGAGGCFSAGADLAELTGTVEDLAMDEAIETVTGAIRAMAVPVIAAIDGPCLGGAFDIAANCDLRIASADAYFHVPATRMGLLYNPRSVARMRKRLGRDVVFRLLVLGQRFDAEAALRVGIVSQLVGLAESLETAMAIGRDAAGNDPAAVTATKGLLEALDGKDGDGEPGRWEKARRDLLSSPQRRKVIAEAKARHGSS